MSGPDIDPPSMKSATWLEFVEAKKASTEFCGDDAEDLRLSEKAMALVPKALATLDENPVDDDMHLTSAAGAYDMLSKIVEASVDKSALAYAMVVKDIEKDYPDDRRAKWEAAKSGTLAEVPVALKEGFGDVHPDWTVDDILKDARAKQEVQNNIAASMGTFWAKNKDRLLEFDDMEFHATEKQVKKVEAGGNPPFSRSARRKTRLRTRGSDRAGASSPPRVRTRAGGDGRSTTRETRC